MLREWDKKDIDGFSAFNDFKNTINKPISSNLATLQMIPIRIVGTVHVYLFQIVYPNWPEAAFKAIIALPDCLLLRAIKNDGNDESCSIPLLEL